ncbi:HNH endonuclease [Mesorhizobium sp. BR1-1-2]|uniref:HNH endonuclease n=1 Tax=Mesorhizobium sp. BR1-1-2 TaxID=2876652 RepID=UPI001CCA3F27|nr:HNH endonuclease [Mesorhizobium sp. BR1-1-2]MBZ9963739.1 HNH endonuclease [Mesorhizobium sp. BR1-1-2]
MRAQSAGSVRLPLTEIESLVGTLPKEARTPQFWANARGHHSSRRSQWLNNDYEAFYDPSNNLVRFERVESDLDSSTSSTKQEGSASSILRVGNTYTRNQLREIFGIVDATLNNGVFKPKDLGSVWLFVTEEKTADRTQYRDRIEGDLLYWQGQTSGRTDHLITGHRDLGLELLLFFRERKYEFDGAGFRYFGPYEYVRHSGSSPTNFVLRSAVVAPDAIDPDPADDEAFDPSEVNDARERVLKTIARRRGQKPFRDKLLKAYGGKCAISGCAVTDVLEAAHIYPYRGDHTNVASNGVLLRSDLHTLFDCGLLEIDPTTMRVVVSERLTGSEYQAFHGRPIRSPTDPRERPSAKALEERKAMLAATG